MTNGTFTSLYFSWLKILLNAAENLRGEREFSGVAMPE